MRWGIAHCLVGSHTLHSVNASRRRHAATALWLHQQQYEIAAEAGAVLRARVRERWSIGPAVERGLLEALGETQLNVRLAAALAVATRKGWAAPRTAAILVHALGEVNPARANDIALALVRLGTRAENAVFGAIVDPVRTRSDRVRCMRAVGVAARLGLDSAVSILVQLRRSSHANLRLASIAALSQLKSADWALMRFLSDPLPIIRSKAAEALSARDQLALSAATNLLRDADASVRKQAAKRLRQLGIVAVPSLVKIAFQPDLSLHRYRPWRLRWSAAWLLIAISLDQLHSHAESDVRPVRRGRT